MKNIIFIMLFTCLIINGCGVAVTTESEKVNNFSQTSNENNEDYTTTRFLELSVAEVYEKQNSGDKFFLYIGRNNCPYCLEFIAKLNAVVDTIDTRIYYLDSVDTYDNSSNELKEFRDLYDVETVPAFKLFKGKDVLNSLEISRITTQEEIGKFIKSELNDASDVYLQNEL